MIRKSSDAVVQKPGQRLPSLEKPAGKLSALPAMDHTKQQEKLRKILGDTSEEAEEIMLNKKPKIGLSTKNSYKPTGSVKSLGRQNHM